MFAYGIRPQRELVFARIAMVVRGAKPVKRPSREAAPMFHAARAG
jgi:hypothetical protein